MSPKSDLPFGSEFSPSQIELDTLLEFADAYPDNQSLQEAIRHHYFSAHSEGNLDNQRKLAMNCRLGMKAYGILDEHGVLTPFGLTLYENRHDSARLHDMLAQHILLNLNGMSLIQCLQDMVVAGEDVTLTSLRQALAERGIHFPAGGKHPSMMRLWLHKAGVIVGTRWQVDSARLQEVLGTDPATFAALGNLTTVQRTFLLALANSGVTTPQPASEIVKLAQAVYGVTFPEKSLPRLVLEALVAAGYITVTKTTDGRGAKPFLVAPTEQLQVDIVEPMLAQLAAQTDPTLMALLRKPLTEILTEIESEGRYESGIALEALAFKLMLLLDMTYVGTRLRAQSTGGAEVDLIFESSRLIFSRWQVQCKNTARVALDDVAKEVGLTHMLKSTVIVIVSTGSVSSEARRYANKVMADSNLCIVIADGTDLDMVRQRPSHIVNVFNREADHAMSLKKLSL